MRCGDTYVDASMLCRSLHTMRNAVGGGTFIKVGGTSGRQNYRKFLWFELATATTQALKYDIIIFCQHV